MIVINCVMSSNVTSSIFNDIILYFKTYSNYKFIQTIKPIQNASLYFYFRPHLEKKLQENSVVTVHHDLNDIDPNLKITLFIERYKEAKLVICLNSEQQKLLRKYQIFHTVVIPHGYNDEVLIKKETFSLNEKITLGFFSSHYPRLVKGEDYLIRLFSNLNMYNIKFILVGKKRNILAEQLNQIGYECLSFEYLPYKLYGKLYTKIDFLVNTSKFEGGPASLPEALYTKTPVITTRLGISNDISSSLIYFLSGDIEEDTILLKKIFDERKTILYNATKTTSKEIYSWQEIIRNYDNVFEEILKSTKIVKIGYMQGILTSFIEQCKFIFQTLHIKKNLIVFIKMLSNVFTFYRTLK